ncbi:pentatricopeptide repeat-containing protein At3g14730-like isoform X1 [Cucurbita pepo subsp. pepo]|uniref:pentatricopeptide repeat-containing protein At3g14730-like isoform X1 n=2 Tax=Cucurbita pepo subsp. pepo TaxID=3664 RepID=UPI000C9D68B7|nr:pentatricopeptide repeat-containing protein At3g14730-like isoform X1 [Cucurbita pepo subsp. pepo]XP_023517269.1 pentatricopeptide repeat-containing protein At3g14730-like isoform X1 [Cucurbita pepo subsp. pepo]
MTFPVTMLNMLKPSKFFDNVVDRLAWCITNKKISTKIVSKKHYFVSSSFLSLSTSLPSKPSDFRLLDNVTTCIAFLQSCAESKNLNKGKQLHSVMITYGFSHSPSSITSLINMYSKCGRMEEAVLVFHDPCYEPNVFAYNAIISGFVANGLASIGFQFYKQMKLEGVMPDKYTFPCVVRSCCEVMEVKKIHGCLFKMGLELDLFVGSALVNTYLKLGSMEDAQEVFEELPIRDVVLWNAMINGYAQIGCLDEALEIFRRMHIEGVSPSRFTITGILSIFALKGHLDNGRTVHGIVMKMGYDSGVAVSNALVDMYGKCKHIGDALMVFETMNEKDIFSWNSIISVHEQCGDHDGALRLFDKMLGSGFLPDLVTVTTILPACSHLAALMHGREIHGYMIVNGLGRDGDNGVIDDLLVNNAVMDMYAKCGSMKNAQKVFNSMTNKDVASWNIMIMGYGMHGYGMDALDMFSHMCEAKIKPDEVTFVGVLSACNHAGFVCQGRSFLAQMEHDFGVIPTIEHYTCVIDMLGRAGHLEDAYDLAQTMPIEANPVVWRALLGACRLHGNAELAEIAAQKVMQLDPEHCGSYVLMSNVYGVVGRYEEVLEVRNTMKEQHVRKTPGCSWIELKDGVHVFLTGDRTHLELNALTSQLCDIGFILDEVLNLY